MEALTTQLRKMRHKLKRKRRNFEITEIFKRRNFEADGVLVYAIDTVVE